MLPNWQLKVLASNVNVVGRTELAESTPFFVKENHSKIMHNNKRGNKKKNPL
jgi:hypothetical protein